MAQLLQPLQYGTLWTLGDGVFYPPGNDQVQATRMARGPGDELDTICGRTLLPSPPGTGHPVGKEGMGLLGNDTPSSKVYNGVSYSNSVHCTVRLCHGTDGLRQDMP